MKSIGFKNFRKFVDFPELTLSDITLLVGANNSGKSTLVKSILLVLDYLRTQQNDRLSFDRNTLNDVNIVTFDRALYNKANVNEIVFNCVLSDFNIAIYCIGSEGDTFASIARLSINDNKENICLVINYRENTISFKLSNELGIDSIDYNGKDSQNKIKAEIESLQRQISEAANFNDVLRLQYDLSSMEQRLKRSMAYNKPTPISSDYTFVEYPINHRIQNDIDGIIFSSYIDDFIATNKNFISVIQDKKNKSKIQKNTIVDMKHFDQHSSRIYGFSEKLKEVLFKNRFIYLAAHSSKQSALFSIRDRSNVLSMAVHEFYKLKSAEKSEEREFVKQWMQKFNVGDDFDIKPQASEAYTLKVLSNGEWVHLGDKGMGSIQIMILILQLATVISQYRDTIDGNLIMIEEPELNLHPRLQSQLADLFFDMNKKYGLRFLVETHSEYLIRRTQVIVAKQNYKDEKDLIDGNKFSVYYFPEQEMPYSMKYLSSGRFENRFDNGFYDEASRSTLELSKMEREGRV